MEVIVRKKTMVRPASTTPQMDLWNSNLDILMSEYTGSMVLIYEPVEDSSFFKTATLIDALEKTLVHYYPMAGRFVKEDQPRIQCNAEGVVFLEAEIDTPFNEVDFNKLSQIRQLYSEVEDHLEGNYPACTIQVTRFKGGGASIGICSPHVAGDGNANISFVKSWSDAARGLDVAVRTCSNRRMLSPRDPPRPVFAHKEIQHVANTDPSEPPTKVQFSTFTVSGKQVIALKEEANGSFSTVKVLAAHVWRCCCIARGLDDNTKTSLYIDVDCRRRFCPPLPEGYFGNAVYFAQVEELVGDIKNKGLNYVASKIQSAITEINDEYLRSAIDYIEVRKSGTPVSECWDKYKCPNLGMTSWVGFPLNDVDFGWGKPAFVRPTQVVEGFMYFIPSSRGDGGVVVGIGLEPKHMDVFEQLMLMGPF